MIFYVAHTGLRRNESVPWHSGPSTPHFLICPPRAFKSRTSIFVSIKFLQRRSVLRWFPATPEKCLFSVSSGLRSYKIRFFHEFKFKLYLRYSRILQTSSTTIERFHVVFDRFCVQILNFSWISSIPTDRFRDGTLNYTTIILC